MQSIPDGMEVYVHRLIHESWMKELVKEYHSLYALGIQDRVYLKSKGCIVANYRDFVTDWGRYKCICGCSYYYGIRRRDGKSIEVPKRYFYSSGMISLYGYK